MHLIGRRGYKSEAYPSTTPPNFGIPDEIMRYYFLIDDSITPGETYTSRPWNAADAALIQTVPPPDFFFPVPVPPCALVRAALSVVTVIDGGAITGDDILIQWRGILGNNPVIAIPAPALGAQQTFIETNVLGALPSGTISIVNYNFQDVIVPLGGATIFPDLLMPANLDIPASSSFICFLSVGIDWNADLINEPFGPPAP
jgi:hypothetical protein